MIKKLILAVGIAMACVAYEVQATDFVVKPMPLFTNSVTTAATNSQNIGTNYAATTPSGTTFVTIDPNVTGFTIYALLHATNGGYTGTTVLGYNTSTDLTNWTTSLPITLSITPGTNYVMSALTNKYDGGITIVQMTNTPAIRGIRLDSIANTQTNTVTVDTNTVAFTR